MKAGHFMAYKIAVGSSDGKMVNLHFGKCDRFLILHIDETTDEFVVEGFRIANPLCRNNDHKETDFQTVVETLHDCRIVLVSRIGTMATKALQRNGIESLEYDGLIQEAVSKLNKYYKRAGVI
jgi:nitrogen fixation protein NifX